MFRGLFTGGLISDEITGRDDHSRGSTPATAWEWGSTTSTVGWPTATAAARRRSAPAPSTSPSLDLSLALNANVLPPDPDAEVLVDALLPILMESWGLSN